jgi:hypothetical protein
MLAGRFRGNVFQQFERVQDAKIPSALKCHLCVRNKSLPMCSVRTVPAVAADRVGPAPPLRPGSSAQGPVYWHANYWNATAGQTWAQLQTELDAQIEPLGLEGLRVLAPVTGEHIVDIGCGCGQTSLDLAARVGAQRRRRWRRHLDTNACDCASTLASHRGQTAGFSTTRCPKRRPWAGGIRRGFLALRGDVLQRARDCICQYPCIVNQEADLASCAGGRSTRIRG